MNSLGKKVSKVTRLEPSESVVTPQTKGRHCSHLRGKSAESETARRIASSETQGQLELAGKNCNGREKKLGRRKVKKEEKSPWGQGF